MAPKHVTTDKFFLTYRDGKVINLPMGKYTIGMIPKVMATYLQLENPESYTGHALPIISNTVCKPKSMNIL